MFIILFFCFSNKLLAQRMKVYEYINIIYIYLHNGTDSKLFNPFCSQAKTKVKLTMIRDILFADDVAVAAQIPPAPHLWFTFPMHRFWIHYQLQKKHTNILALATTSPHITLNNYQLEVGMESSMLVRAIYDIGKRDDCKRWRS